MGRPTYTPRTGVSASANPFRSWIENRNAKKAEKAEEKAKEAVNAASATTNDLIRTLQETNFLHSQIPAAILDRRTTDENQKVGDLEYFRNYIVQVLNARSTVVKADLRPIDEQLITLAGQFKDAVEKGDINAAYAARAALAMGVDTIRDSVPENQPEDLTQYIERSAKYLGEWVTLVQFAQTIDIQERRVQSLNADTSAMDAELAGQIEEMRERLEGDPDYAEAFAQVLYRSAPEHRINYNKMQREVFQQMLERRRSQVKLGLSSAMLIQNESLLETQRAQLELLSTKLSVEPTREYKNLMNRCQEAMDGAFEDMAKNDAQIEETLKKLDDYEGRIKQLDQAGGAVRAMETVVETAESVVSEIRAQQDKELARHMSKTSSALERLGIRDQETQRELEQQADTLREAEKAREQNTQKERIRES